MNKTILIIIASFIMLAAPVTGTGADLPTGGGDITFKLPNIDPVHFSHEYHVKGRGIKCTACHFQQFAEAGGSYKMKKGVITKQKFCGHCHNGLKGFDTASDKNCGRCHKK